MASKTRLPSHLRREKLAFQYSNALEAGDFETLTSILGVAVHDGVLAQMLREIDEVYAGELEQHVPSRTAGLNTLPSPEQRLPHRPLHLSYWLSLAAVIALVFVVVLKSRLDDSSKGVSSELLTPLAPTITHTPTPTLTLTASPTAQPRETNQVDSPEEEMLTITPKASMLPNETQPIPAGSVPGVVIATIEPQAPNIPPAPIPEVALPSGSPTITGGIIPEMVIPAVDVHIPEVIIPEVVIPAGDPHISGGVIPEVVIPAVDIHIPEIIIPEVVIPTVELHIPTPES